jgi:hypothetical protein
MFRSILVALALLISTAAAGSALAADNDMTFDEFATTCTSNGGTFSYTDGSRTCCWSNWGCLTCVPGTSGWLCTMHCETQSCRNANASGAPPKGPRNLNLPMRVHPAANAPPGRTPQRTPMAPAPTQNAPTR